VAEAGARLAIRLLQDAAERGELDPWDVDVIAVVDGFLDQLRQRIEIPRLVASLQTGRGGSYEQDLAASSEAFLAASVLVGLKAEVLERQTFPPPPLIEDPFGCDSDDGDDWGIAGHALPRRPERNLWRRPVAPPPLQRPVSLGELIRQLEDIAERMELDGSSRRPSRRNRPYSERAAIEQVAALAHREKLPETTAALSLFLQQWPPAMEWVNFEDLVEAWAVSAPGDLDSDRVGVFWALLFLCSQGRLDLKQDGGLFGPLHLKRLLGVQLQAIHPETNPVQVLKSQRLKGPASSPARQQLAA
jgi:segregation and condensation protein A